MNRPRYTVDPELARAGTLPGAFYTDPAAYDVLLDTAFARSWQFVTAEARVRTPGQCLPLTLLEGSLDEPLLLTRDAGDGLHCLSNVCTHRANVVCAGECVAPTLRCRYHGRRFELDGRMTSMPEFGEVASFPRPEDDLPRVALGAWGGLLFASLAPDRPFDTLASRLDQRLSHLPFASLRHDPLRSRDYLVRAHWALYVDNYLEGFHIPYVHAGLSQALDYGEYRVELFDRGVLQIGVAAPGESAFPIPEHHPDAGLAVAAWYWWLFPNTMINVYPWGLSINVVQPLALDRTKVSFIAYVWDETEIDRGAGAGLDRVEREDEVIVEAVQRGVASRLYPGGRFSVRREPGVHHFHRMLAACT